MLFAQTLSSSEISHYTMIQYPMTMTMADLDKGGLNVHLTMIFVSFMSIWLLNSVSGLFVFWFTMEILVRVLPNIKHALKKLTWYAVSIPKRYTIKYQKIKIKIVKCLVTNSVFFNIYECQKTKTKPINYSPNLKL